MKIHARRAAIHCLLIFAALACCRPLIADDAKADEQLAQATKEDDAKWKQLGPNLWIDQADKRVIVDGHVAITDGMIEMFACLNKTKEHESVVALDTKAFMIHAALLAVGAKKGTPVEFRPKYKPATGTRIDVYVAWTDKKGKRQTARAQDWIRNVKTKKAMEHSFVFVGSGMWKDPDTGEQYYSAEAGDVICVSNFPSALLDLPVESSQSAGELLFEAFTERIPEEDAKVRVFLVPKFDKAESKDDSSEKKEEASEKKDESSEKKDSDDKSAEKTPETP